MKGIWRKKNCVATFVFNLFFLALKANGDPQPQFIEEWAIWDASHIVVVTEGEKVDGELEILESWEGDLQRGDRLHLPKLADFARGKALNIGFISGDNPPFRVTGSRLVLFLVKAARGFEFPSRGGLEGSTVWIEGGEAYAYRVEERYTGIRAWGGSEGKLRAVVLRMLKAKAPFTRAVALAEPWQRAEALTPFLNVDLDAQRDAAWEELQRCGEAAIPIVRRMLRDPTALTHCQNPVGLLENLGGEAAGCGLVMVLDEELKFWKETGPTLRKGWDEDPSLGKDNMDLLEKHMGYLFAAIGSAQHLRLVGARPALVATRDLWKSLPQLSEYSIASHCDYVLRNLPATRLLSR